MSDKVRVYEIAEEAGASSSEVIRKAKDLNLELKSPQSAVSFEDAEEIANYIMTGKSNKLVTQIIAKVKKIDVIEKKILRIDDSPIKKPNNKGLRIIKKGTKNRKILISEKRIKPNTSNKQDLTTNEEENKHSLKIDEIINNDKQKILDKLKNNSKEPLKKENSNHLKSFMKKDESLKYTKIKKTENLIVNNELDQKVNININEKRSDLILNSYPEVTIEIKKLKTIEYLKWNLQKEPGVYALIGENGSGKSSLLVSIAKLIEPTIFHHELTGSRYYENTEIIYTINDKNFKWIKNKTSNNNWRQSSEDKINMPKLKGFVESSILSGTRFNKIDDYIKDELEYRNDDIVVPASDFMKDAMNYILFGKRASLYKFNNLCKVNAKRKRQNRDRTFTSKEYSYHALNLKDTEYIKEHLFSTGEYFLLQLLKFIDNFKNNAGSIIPALIVIDEVELSLHPLAQARLTERLKDFAKKFKLIILFASHSLHILEKINAKNTFFIERNVMKKHIISNPIHLGYLTTKLYKHQFYDKVILVEDKLAKLYIEHTLNDLAHHNNLDVGIITVGGSTEVVNAAIENCHEKFYGDADVMVSLDEDRKKDAYGKKKYIKWCQHIPVKMNIENYVGSLVKTEDVKFIKFIEKLLINESYYNLNIGTKSQKTAFNTLVAEIATNTMGRFQNNKDFAKSNIEKEIVEYVYNQHVNVDEQELLVQEITNLFEYDKR